MLDLATAIKSPDVAPRCDMIATLSRKVVDDISVAAQQRFAVSPHFSLRSVTCEQRAGKLVLRGRVSSYYQKQLAQEVVRNLAGPLTIFNVVEVVAPESAKVEWPVARSSSKSAKPKQGVTS